MEIAAAFALCNENAGADYVTWKNKQEKAVYIDRLESCQVFKRRNWQQDAYRGHCTCKSKGSKYLRLFVVDSNEPAINLYRKNGLKRLRESMMK